MGKTVMTMDLPKVGDRLMRVMSKYACEYENDIVPKACVVTHVNEKNRWYQVKFIDTGLKECYGLPFFDHSIFTEKTKQGHTCIPVACVETGIVYSSYIQCSKEMHIDPTCLYRQVNGEYEQINGYHFIKVL